MEESREARPHLSLPIPQKKRGPSLEIANLLEFSYLTHNFQTAVPRHRPTDEIIKFLNQFLPRKGVLGIAFGIFNPGEIPFSSFG